MQQEPGYIIHMFVASLHKTKFFSLSLFGSLAIIIIIASEHDIHEHHQLEK